MRFCLLTSVLAIVICYSHALNILGIFPYHGKSHFIVFRVFLQELIRKGHNVTVISHYPEKNPPQNYHDISLAGSIWATEDSLPVEKRTYKTLIGVSLYLTLAGKENCEVMLANNQVRNLVDEKRKFDVIVVEQFNSDCALGLAYKLNAPVVGMTSHILMPWHYNRYGIAYNPSYVSFHFMEGGTKPTLCQRVERTVFDTYFKLLYYFVTQRSDQNTLGQYYNDIPPLEELAKEIKFLLISHHFTLTGPSLLPPNVIEVGGYHVAKAKQLSGELQKFVENAEAGVIYISFGSTMKISTMQQDKLEAILGAINELPQRFIWRWDDLNIDKPQFTDLRSDLRALLMNREKLYVSTWLPQVDILGHPKTVAFFSHAGMGGTTESIHFGVPVVALPILGDQPANAASIEESGLGVQISVTELTKDNLVGAFKQVLEPRFQEKVKQLHRAWHDRPLSPMDTAIFWTEYAARNANFTFRSAAADVPLYQYLNLDVAFVFILMFVTLIATVKVITWPCRHKKKAQVQKKQQKKRN